MRSRPFALFLSVLIFLFSVFVVPVGASSDNNLVNTNILTWGKSTAVTLSHINGISRIYLEPYDFTEGNSVVLSFFGCYTPPSLVVGHNYSLSIRVPSVSEINKALGTSLTESQITSSLNTANLSVWFGIGYKDSVNHNLGLVKDFSYSFTGPELSSYLGKTITFDFDYETRRPTGIPVFFVGFETLDVNNAPRIFYFAEPTLIDNDSDNSEGLFNNLIEFLKLKFSEITSGFTQLKDTFSTYISDLSTALSDKLSEVKNSVSNLGNTLTGYFDTFRSKIEGFFTGCFNLLLYFDWEGDYVNPFETENGPVSLISDTLNDVISYVSDTANDLINIVDSISGSVTLLDEFVQEFDWLFMLVGFSLFLVVVTRFIGL